MLPRATIRLGRRGFRGACSFGARFALALFALGLALLAQPAGASCGAEGCPLDNSSLGGGARRFSFELSYQQVEQDKILVRDQKGDLATIYAEGGEVRTRSRVTMGKAVYFFGSQTFVAATLPYVDRLHQHVTAEGVPEPELREWQYSGLGDLTVLGSWSAYHVETESPLTFAVQGGVKLPTGRRHVPPIEGEEPEPHARPGTGSTDLLAGLQIIQTVTLPIPRGASAPSTFFLSGLYTHTTKGTEGHRVGRMLDAHFGAAYPVVDHLQILGQVNYRARGPDHLDVASGSVEDGHQHLVIPERTGPVPATRSEEVAANGDVLNTGGVALFFSPGLRFQANPWMAVSGYVQIPLYQRVNGTQDVAAAQFWLGATYQLP